MRPLYRRWSYWSGVGLLVLLLLGDMLIVSKPKPPPTEPEQGAEAIEPQQMSEATGPGHVTAVNFALVRKGMSRDEVDSLLGREHRFLGGSDTGLARGKISSYVEERIYEEGQGPARKQAFVKFEMRNFTVIDKELVAEPTDPGHVTEANFAKIRKGMTQEEVEHLLGREHRTLGWGNTLRSEDNYEEGQGPTRKIARLRFEVRGRTAPDGRIDYVHAVVDKLFETNDQNTGWQFGK